MSTLVDSNRRDALLNQETVMEAQFKNPQPRLIPRYAFVETLVADLMTKTDPTLFVENLYIYKKASRAHLPAWSGAERQALFNRVVSLSSLTGIQYYSNSRKTMRILYESSTVIDGPDTKRPLPDPVYGQPPQSAVLYARQKDLTFGDNVYRYIYYALPEALVFVQQNHTPLTAGIIPAIGKDNLRSVVAVIDAEEHLLIYAGSMAKAASLPGMNQRVGKSFASRTDALFRWFTSQADRAFAEAR
ncbi:MAG: hypothetical protein LBG73_01125 [Spirochaetaceae bacterium]|nr:hypothetical protein [Spirochaetaceae bacterium]